MSSMLCFYQLKKKIINHVKFHTGPLRLESSFEALAWMEKGLQAFVSQHLVQAFVPDWLWHKFFGRI